MELFLALLRDPNVVTGIAAFLLVVAIIVGAELWRHVRANERLSKYINAIKYAKDRAEDMFLFIRTEGLDMTAVKIGDKVVDYTEREANSEDIYGRKVDARMLFVLDDLELNVFNKFGLKIEFDDIIPRAEAWYQKLRLADNGIVMNDKDAVAAQNGPTLNAQLVVETDAERARRSLAQRARREAERLAKEAEAQAAKPTSGITLPE